MRVSEQVLREQQEFHERNIRLSAEAYFQTGVKPRDRLNRGTVSRAAKLNPWTYKWDEMRRLYKLSEPYNAPDIVTAKDLANKTIDHYLSGQEPYGIILRNGHRFIKGYLFDPATDRESCFNDLVIYIWCGIMKISEWNWFDGIQLAADMNIFKTPINGNSEERGPNDARMGKKKLYEEIDSKTGRQTSIKNRSL